MYQFTTVVVATAHTANKHLSSNHICQKHGTVGLCESLPPNAISLSLAIFAELIVTATIKTHRQTMRDIDISTNSLHLSTECMQCGLNKHDI